MDTQQQANVFRMSATLFANNNYQISPVQLHRRVVEDALFVMNDDRGVTVGALADYIEKEYFFSFDENELLKVLHDSKFSQSFEWRSAADADTRYLLKQERRETLRKRVSKTLNDFIAEYLTLNNLSVTRADAIYQYLYGVFTTNVDSFKRMLEVQDVKELSERYTPQEQDVDIINGFLDWENDQKNVAIFNLASYALEFCLLTSKKGSNVKLESLKHKTFYLDTNILYRAIGINGEDRKLRSLSFLRKLKESEDDIKISKVTWEEYESSLKSYIKRLRRSETPAVRSKVYTEYITYDDIYRYYHLWAIKRHNATVDLFVDWIHASMKALMEDYDIEIDSLSPFGSGNQKDTLGEMAAQIMGYGKSKSYDTALNDALNIKWVESKRKSGENTIFSTKTFLISSDRGLYVWDSKYHSKQTPIVVMPSQWLSLLLRYVTRSNDDFRSFVCFLNIQDKEGVLSSEQMNVILAGIAEMTNNVEQQKYFLETIIEREFKDGSKGKTNDQLKAIARNEAERLLQQQLDEMKAAHNELKDSFAEIHQQFDKHKKETDQQLRAKDEKIESANNEIKRLQTNIQALNEDYMQKQDVSAEEQNKKDDRIRMLEQELKTEKDRNTFYKKRRIRIAWKLGGITVLLGLIVWFFCSSKESNDVMGHFIAWIDAMEGVQQHVAKGVSLLIISAMLIPLIRSLCKDITSKYDNSLGEEITE